MYIVLFVSFFVVVVVFAFLGDFVYVWVCLFFYYFHFFDFFLFFRVFHLGSIFFCLSVVNSSFTMHTFD